MLLFKILQNRNHLKLEFTAESGLQFFQGADPFSGSYSIDKTFQPPVGSPVVSVGAEHKVIKEKRASICSDALVRYQCLYEVAVNAAAWKLHNLFKF